MTRNKQINIRNTDTYTEYWGISKYRYRIPKRHEKNTDENTEHWYRLEIPIPTQLYFILFTHIGKVVSSDLNFVVGAGAFLWGDLFGL